MSPNADERLRSAARRVARRAGALLDRRSGVVQANVPRLRLAATAPATPTVWMITPDWNKPSGGIRKQYHAVDVLNAAGHPAAVVHERRGFRCSWFEHATTIVAAADVELGPRDVIVVPEIYWPSIRRLPRGIRQVIYNQNAYLTLDALAAAGPAAAAAYVGNPDLGLVAVVSDENAEVLSHAFPDVPIARVRHSIDEALHHPGAEARPRRIAYMPRRRGEEARQVLELLRLRGALQGWEVVPIEGRSETEVAELLRTCRIFLSLSEREGFGLPPCEAIACGCLVVGFDGFAGREFFQPPFARSVENGDVLALARALEALMVETESDPAAARAHAEAGVRFVRERYSAEAERQDLVAAFAPPA
ncbi:glycosyl transferase family 1 [Solirubrobacter pauli]|uniref:Glycosyl transferase family 1 n=1 Tax=Solirubrobacter pauli TaxID=166793 RepID=A0A660LL05_9ACTN|nr:glycosyltransferase [Solirubrobacter pauli]RKQ94101.1 glycosyl transferase family 1 [Solirubrobacter pauli]